MTVLILILVYLHLSDFEEMFKLSTQPTNQPDKGVKPEATPRKKPQKTGLLDSNRSQNVAIARKKITFTSEELGDVIAK